MFKTDDYAWDVLYDNFWESNLCIYKKDADHSVTDKELEAIDYLCKHWGYSFYPGEI